MLGFIEGFIRFRQRALNVFTFEHGDADADGHVSGDAFVKHMGDFKIVNLLTYAFSRLARLLQRDVTQQHHKFFPAKPGDNIA